MIWTGILLLICHVIVTIGSQDYLTWTKDFQHSANTVSDSDGNYRSQANLHCPSCLRGYSYTAQAKKNQAPVYSWSRLGRNLPTYSYNQQNRQLPNSWQRQDRLAYQTPRYRFNQGNRLLPSRNAWTQAYRQDYQDTSYQQLLNPSNTLQQLYRKGNKNQGYYLNRQVRQGNLNQALNQLANVNQGLNQVVRQANVNQGLNQVVRQGNVNQGVNQVARQGNLNQDVNQVARQGNLNQDVNQVARQGNVNQGVNQVARQGNLNQALNQLVRQRKLNQALNQLVRQGNKVSRYSSKQQQRQGYRNPNYLYNRPNPLLSVYQNRNSQYKPPKYWKDYRLGYKNPTPLWYRQGRVGYKNGRKQDEWNSPSYLSNLQNRQQLSNLKLQNRLSQKNLNYALNRQNLYKAPTSSASALNQQQLNRGVWKNRSPHPLSQRQGNNSLDEQYVDTDDVSNANVALRQNGGSGDKWTDLGPAWGR